MCCPLQMESRRLVSVLCLVLAPAPATAASPADDQLRLEIAEAASDSRLLADELADMLARLEADQSRQQAVEAAVRGKLDMTEVSTIFRGTHIWRRCDLCSPGSPTMVDSMVVHSRYIENYRGISWSPLVTD